MKQPRTYDDLVAAGRAANVREHRALEAAGLTRADVMDAVETIDRLDGVTLAFADAPTVLAELDRDNPERGMDALATAGYDYHLDQVGDTYFVVRIPAHSV